jgi:S1-C subfamily serine protease
VRSLIAALPLVLALFTLAAPATAQREVRTPPTGPDVLGFSYGWAGGITVGTDGSVRMRDHPRVGAVRRGSGAAAAGLVAGDVILSVDGRDARDPSVLRDLPGGARVQLVVRRDGRERRLVLHTAPPPDR